MDTYLYIYLYTHTHTHTYMKTQMFYGDQPH